VLLGGKLTACLGEAGEVERGLDTVEQAIARSDETEERWVMDELLRVKGAGARPNTRQPGLRRFTEGFDRAEFARRPRHALPPMTVS